MYHHIVVSYVNSSDKLLLDSVCKWQNCKKSFSTKLYYCMWMKRVQFRQGSSHPQRSPPYHVPIWSAILKPTTAPWKGSLGCTVIYCNWNKWTAASFAHLHSVAIMYNIMKPLVMWLHFTLGSSGLFNNWYLCLQAIPSNQTDIEYILIHNKNIWKLRSLCLHCLCFISCKGK